MCTTKALKFSLIILKKGFESFKGRVLFSYELKLLLWENLDFLMVENLLWRSSQMFLVIGEILCFYVMREEEVELQQYFEKCNTQIVLQSSPSTTEKTEAQTNEVTLLKSPTGRCKCNNSAHLLPLNVNFDYCQPLCQTQ